MTFTIHKEAPKTYLVTMGQAKREVIHGRTGFDSGGGRNQEGTSETRASRRKGAKAEEGQSQASAEEIGGKMADEKKLGEETGVKKIHQERADKQGPIGTGAEKTPDTDAGGEDLTIGNKEGDKDNG